jgi:glycosyltransferase involved in cell wall biosynthesis
MHVLIDAHVFEPRGRGMAHFAEEFVHGLAEAGSELRFTVLSRFPGHLPTASNLRCVGIPDVPAPLWEQLLLPFAIRRHRPDVLHALANTLPVYRSPGVARVVTLHDVMFMHPDPEISAGETFVQKVGKAYRTRVCRWTIPACDAVFTVSRYSATQIEAAFPSQLGRVQVLRQGPSLQPPHPAPPAPAQPYVLLPSGNHSRKNARRAIEAFLRFRRATGSPWQLWVFGVGPAQLDLAPFGAGREPGEVEAAVRLLGYVPEQDLPGLFHHAELVFFPSLHEGLGLPVLDAITLGKPVLTSNVSSLPEVAGAAGLYVDPWSLEEMAAGLARLHADPALKAALAAQAGPQASRFSWAGVAAQSLGVYRAVGSAGPRPSAA